jgi:predicted transposase YbfD/YdcC
MSEDSLGLVSFFSVIADPRFPLILGQVKVDDKSNEITAIPKLLDLLNLKGTTVTVDAMGCQTDIAKRIFDKGGDHLFSLKGNQGTIHNEVVEFFEDERKTQFKNINHDTWETTEKGHGRIEERFYLQTEEVDWMEDKGKWKNLKSIGFVDAKRTIIIKEKTSEETRYFLSSLTQDAEIFSHTVRGHWGIENSLHWCLDVSMQEDQSRIRIKNAAENFSVLRRIALNLLKKAPLHKTKKQGSLTSKSKWWNWDKDYLLKVMFG